MLKVQATDHSNPNKHASESKEQKRIVSLRDFLDLLKENGQYLIWPDEVTPEPDIRNAAVAAGRNSMGGPAILFDQIKGYHGKSMVLGVHGSFDNIAILLGHSKGTTIKELFYDLAGRWGSTGGN